jgi:cell division septal protein FtsQ
MARRRGKRMTTRRTREGVHPPQISRPTQALSARPSSCLRAGWFVLLLLLLLLLFFVVVVVVVVVVAASGVLLSWLLLVCCC